MNITDPNAPGLDLPSIPEVRRILDTWRTIAPSEHRVALTKRDLQRARVLSVGGEVPPVVGAGAWWIAELPTVSDDPAPLEGEPVRLCAWAYQRAPGRLEEMVAFIAPPAPAERERRTDLSSWRRMHWPAACRAMLLLHRLAASQLPPGVLLDQGAA
jgi:hypothetical protein